MNWKREKKQERRKRKGLRKGWKGVIPPSHGKRLLPLTKDHLFRFDELRQIVAEDERLRFLDRTAEGDAFERLCAIHDRYDIAGLAKFGFPERYVLEIDDDDALEVWLTLSFT